MRDAFLEKAGGVAGLRFAELLKPGDPNSSPDFGFVSLLRGWGATGADEALEWVTRSSGSFKLHLFPALIAGIGETDPEKAEVVFHSLEPPLQVQAIDEMVAIKASGGIEGILMWNHAYLEEVRGAGHPEEVERGLAYKAFEATSEKLAQTDPESMAVWVQGALDDLDVASALYDEDPDSLKTFIDRWVDSDPSAAEQWIAGMEGKLGYDRLAANYSRTLATKNYPSAIQIAESIEHPGIRSKTLSEIKFLDATTRFGVSREDSLE